MDNKEEKPKTEKKGKYVVKDGEGNIISQNMPKEFEDMIEMCIRDSNMTVQPPVHHHAAFHIHFISHFQQADVGTLYRFFHGGNRVDVYKRQLSNCVVMVHRG